MKDLEPTILESDPLERATAAIARLGEIFEHGSGVSIGGNVLVRRDEVLDLLAVLREEVPSTPEIIAQADQRGAQLLDSAQQLAIEIEQDARQEAADLVSSEAVVTAAQREAERIHRSSQRQAEQTRAEANQYFDEKLVALESALGRSLAQVQLSRDKLAGDL